MDISVRSEAADDPNREGSHGACFIKIGERYVIKEYSRGFTVAIVDYETGMAKIILTKFNK